MTSWRRHYAGVQYRLQHGQHVGYGLAGTNAFLDRCFTVLSAQLHFIKASCVIASKFRRYLVPFGVLLLSEAKCTSTVYHLLLFLLQLLRHLASVKARWVDAYDSIEWRSLSKDGFHTTRAAETVWWLFVARATNYQYDLSMSAVSDIAITSRYLGCTGCHCLRSPNNLSFLSTRAMLPMFPEGLVGSGSPFSLV